MYLFKSGFPSSDYSARFVHLASKKTQTVSQASSAKKMASEDWGALTLIVRYATAVKNR